MTYRETVRSLAAYREQIVAIRAKIRAAQAAVEPESVQDYEFGTPHGTRRLSDLFGEKGELIVIHNMGTSCRYCTMWADGFNGVYQHLADRAAFVVTSPDPPALQQRFAADRNWRFPMASHQGSSFAADMGYRSESGGWLPGISVFRRDKEGIVRLSDTRLGPGDDFCSVWHFFDLFPEGSAGWEAQYRYA